MPIPLGILAAAGASASASSAYELISTVNLGSTSNFSFTSLPTTFKHFQLRFSVRDATGSIYTSMQIRVNNNSNGGNYIFNNQGGSAQGGSSTAFNITTNYNTILGSSSLANTYSLGVVDFYNVNQSSTRKSILGRIAGTTSLFDGGNAVLLTGFYIGTEVISSIQISSASGYVANSRVSLYGIRG